MALTGLSQMPPSVRTGLGPGEEPLAWQTVALTAGESRIGRTGPPRAVTGIHLNPLTWPFEGLVDLDPGFFERLLGGVALTGHASSVADRLGRALSSTQGALRLAVTTERVLLFSEGGTTFGTDPATGGATWDAATELLWEIPRTSVRSARVRARPLMAGRLVLLFADGSSAALMCGMLSGRAGRRLRAALDPAGR